MPRSPSPERSRRRSASPRRDRDRSHSPQAAGTKTWAQRRPKELSFYKRQAYVPAAPPRSGMAAGEIGEEETAKERAQRRERGEVPKRFGGSREQGVRNTMGNVAAPVANSSVGSFKRSGDPLDRLGVRGEKRDKDRDARRDSGDRDHDRRRDDRDRGSRPEPQRDLRHPDRRDPPPGTGSSAPPLVRPGRFIEVIANDRMGRKVRIKCLPTDTVGDLKKLIAAQTGTSAQKIVLKKWYTAFKDHVSLQDYEINDGMSLEMY